MTEEGFFDVSEMLECGVYLLLRKGIVVYVGQSRRDMLTRVYTHAYNARTKRKMMRWQQGKPTVSFDEVWVRPCSREELDDLEQSLIVKYHPRHNSNHKPRLKVPMPLANIVMQVMAHRGVTTPASPSAAPRPQIDRRGR